MPLPQITGPSATIHTEMPFDFGSVRIILRIGLLGSPVTTRIVEDARQIILQRLIDARAVEVGDLIQTGIDPADAEAQVPEVTSAPVMWADPAVAIPLIAAAVTEFRAFDLSEARGLGDEDPVWEEFTIEDAQQIWSGLEPDGSDAWPEEDSAKLLARVKVWSRHGSANPKAG